MARKLTEDPEHPNITPSASGMMRVVIYGPLLAGEPNHRCLGRRAPEPRAPHRAGGGNATKLEEVELPVTGTTDDELPAALANEMIRAGLTRRA